MRTYTEEEYREVVRKFNAREIKITNLEKENEILRSLDKCACRGWKIATGIMAIYVIIHFFLSR